MRVFLAAVLSLLLPAAAAARSGPWSPRPPLSVARYLLSLTDVDGRLFAVGGCDERGEIGVVEEYDARAGAWRPRASMPTPRCLSATGVLSGRLVAAGGNAVSGYLSAADAYDPAADAWSSLAPVPLARNGRGAVLDGRLYVVGGNAGGSCTSRVDAYDAASGIWSPRAPLPAAVCSAAVAAYGGRLYAFGGTDTSGRTKFRSVWIYDPAADAWSAGAPMPTAREGAGAASLDGRIYVLGGFTGSTHANVVEAYDPSADSWFLKTPMPAELQGPGVAAYGRGLYVAGGSRNSGVSAAVWAYDPRRDPRDQKAEPAWSAAPVARASPPVGDRADDEPALGPRAAPRPDDFALVVGIDRYRAVPEARFGERDAAAFAREAREILGVPAENVILLTGERAARTDLAKYVEEWLPKNVTKESRVYFYYSGHGAPDPADGTAYLIPWDGDASFLKTSGYPLARLYERLGALPAGQVVVFLDSCFSGAGERSLIAANVRPLVTVVSEPPVGRKLSVLTAAAGDETAGSSDGRGHGLFTDALLRGLAGAADAERTGHVDLEDLYRFVSADVVRAAHRQNREQHPRLRTDIPTLRLY